MKPADLYSLAFVTLSILSSPAPAFAGCATAMVPTKVSSPSLPTACQAMGPIHLGMRGAQLIERLGAPNLQTTYQGVRELVYVFPRDLAAKVKEQPEPESYLQQKIGYIRVMLRNNKVVTIDSFSQSAKTIPYSVGGIAVGADIYSLLRTIKIKPSWNASQDNIFFLPYPFEVSVDTDSHTLNGITISSGPPTFGPSPVTHLTKKKGTDLVNSFIVEFETK